MKKEKLKALLAVVVITLALAVSTLAVAQDNENESATYAPSIETLIRTIPTQEEEVWTFNASTLPMALSTIITDPNEGKTVDVKQVDAGCTYSGSTLTHVTFSVTYYTSIDQLTLLSYLWLDTDQNPGTGIKASDLPGYGLNDIGADRFIMVYQGYAYVGDENFNLIATLPVSYTSNSYTVTIPISDLADDGCMDVTQISGNYGDPLAICDIAPNTGHGTVDCCILNCILTISQLDGTTNFPTIKAIAMVTDWQGNPIPGLTKSDFTVTENGQNANNISVNCGGAAGPIDVALALDASGSMSSTDIANVKTAANTFVNYMGTNDRAAVVSFASSVVVKQSLTGDKNALHNAINNYDSGVGTMTSLYDAIIVSVDQVKTSPNIRAVLALTDGYDTYSTHTLQEAINHAVANGVPVYTIGMGGADHATLQQIATQTGGRYYYAPTSSELQQIYTLISGQISSQCEITWTTPFTDCTAVPTRNVEISVSHGGMTCSDNGTYSCGCPDADGDGVCDADDNCPNDPGPAWNCGCPCPGGDADVVFIMDTSGSMDDEFSTLCTKISTIISDLQSQGITVTYKIVGITQNRDCTSDYVTNMVPNPISDHLEDWGPATQDIAEKYSWRAGATRIIIPMSDEGPDNGCPITSEDYTSITNAIASAKANNVRVSPVTCSESGQCTAADYNTVVSLAQQLASATNGTLFKSTDPASDLVNGLIAIIGVGTCDQDGDGVPDGCDPCPDCYCCCGECPGANCTLIHLDGKNCVNQPIVARLTDENENPIQGTIIFSLGGSQFPKTTDAQGYTTFTPQTTGTLTATFDDTAGTTGKIWQVTCEIIDDPTLCAVANFCQDPTQGTVSITSFTTDKTTYTRGQTIKVTMVANNAESCIYKKLLTDVSATKSDTGVPLGFSGSWSMVDTGTNTYEMRLYIPTATAPGSYQVTGGIYTDYIAQGGTIKDIATPVMVTIS